MVRLHRKLHVQLDLRIVSATVQVGLVSGCEKPRLLPASRLRAPLVTMNPLRVVETLVQMSAKIRALVATPRASARRRTVARVMITKELPRHDVRVEGVGKDTGSGDATTGRVRFIGIEEFISEPETLAVENPEIRTSLDTRTSRFLTIAASPIAVTESRALRKLLPRARASR